MKGPGVFVGYYKQEEATREAITADGWLKTGDAGLVDPRGHLAIIDRAKDVGKLDRRHAVRAAVHREQAEIQPLHPRGGGLRRPAPVRGRHDRHRHAAPSATGPSSSGLPYTSYMDLSRKPEVARLIVEEVAKINATLPDAHQVRRIVLLNKELEADDAEMTRTRKVRRASWRRSTPR